MGRCLENLLSIKLNNSIFLGLPKDWIADSAALILLPVYKTSSIRITVLFSTIKSIAVLLAFKTLSPLPKSSLKKVTSRKPRLTFLIE